MWDYGAFIAELEVNFGPHDPVSDASEAIMALKMKETSRILIYNVKFWDLASKLDWNDAALAEIYFQGLPFRLKKEVLHGGKHKTVAAMQEKAQEADNVHWMQKAAEAAEGKTSKDTTKGSKPSKVSSGGSAAHTNSGQNQNRQSSNATPSSSTSNSNPSNTPKPSSSSTPSSIADKLGKDGKLKVEERLRRIKEGLCLYCGKKGHKADECNKRAKARAAATEAAAPTESCSTSSDSKK